MGKTQIPKKNPLMTKIHYQIQLKSGLSKEFRKFVYKVHSDVARVIVHYMGQSSVAEDFPHGNSKRSINFLPTAKSLTNRLDDKCKKLNHLVVETASEPEQFQPRNANQKKYFARKATVSSDSFLVLHELAYMLPGFIWNIATFPDLTVTFGLTRFFELLEMCGDGIFAYDTTFNLGDFYVTTLVAQLGQLHERPIIPIAFMMHERKFQKLHEEFCCTIAKLLPTSVTARTFNICTDGEAGCSNAVKTAFPHWNVFSCWNHILRDIEFWLKKHGGAKDDATVYKSQVQDILNCATDDEYQMTVDSHRCTWSKAFADHFDADIEKKVVTSFKCRLRQCGIDKDSITNNNSECMNAVIKRFQDYKEVGVDKLVFAMYRLQLSYGLQINKSLRGFGPYVCVDGVTAPEMHLPECTEYDDMLAMLGDANFSHRIPDTVTEVSHVLKVIHIPEQQAISVSIPSGAVHSVRLFPKESCTCPVSSGCCHVLAAKKSVGMAANKERRITLG